MQDCIIWVHSGISEQHQKEAIGGVANGTIIGIFCTEALGVVSGLHINIHLQSYYCL